MTLWELMAIAIAMGLDVFSVSAAVASGPSTPRQAFRLSWHFGLFQGLMPVAGWALGKTLLDLIAAYDHWVAFGVLGIIGAHMVYEGFQNEDNEGARDRSLGLSLVALSIATSIDALGIGFTFGITRPGDPIWFYAVVIGLVSVGMSLLGIYMARRLKKNLGPHMEKIGGLVLIGIAVRFLLTG